LGRAAKQIVCSNYNGVANKTVDPAMGVELERLLAPSLVKFLKLASHHYPGGNDSGDCGNFFLYVKQLTPPRNMLDDISGTSRFYPENATVHRYLYIYMGVDCRWLM
jgi:hypothetical protein